MIRNSVVYRWNTDWRRWEYFDTARYRWIRSAIGEKRSWNLSHAVAVVLYKNTWAEPYEDDF